MSSTPSLEDRIAALERRMSRLEKLVADMAKSMGVRSERPDDRAAVTEKGPFDWQKPRPE